MKHTFNNDQFKVVHDCQPAPGKVFQQMMTTQNVFSFVFGSEDKEDPLDFSGFWFSLEVSKYLRLT